MDPHSSENRPLAESLEALLGERRMSLRELARRAETSPSHLSRIMRGVDGKRASGALASRVATALDLPADHFAEARLAAILEGLRADPKLRDEVYELVRVRAGS